MEMNDLNPKHSAADSIWEDLENSKLANKSTVPGIFIYIQSKRFYSVGRRFRRETFTTKLKIRVENETYSAILCLNDHWKPQKGFGESLFRPHSSVLQRNMLWRRRKNISSTELEYQVRNGPLY